MTLDGPLPFRHAAPVERRYGGGLSHFWRVAICGERITVSPRAYLPACSEGELASGARTNTVCSTSLVMPRFRDARRVGVVAGESSADEAELVTTQVSVMADACRDVKRRSATRLNALGLHLRQRMLREAESSDGASCR